MRSFAHWLPRSAFVRNVLTLATGTAAAQAISLLSAPINSRIYTPADYGALGAYMSVSGILATAATLRYHQGVVHTERDEDARDLVGTCLASTGVFSALAAIVALALGPIIAAQLASPALRWWLCAVPVSTACAGVGTSLTCWLNRQSAYRSLASMRLVTSLVPVPVTIVLGLWIDGPTGLLTGLIVSHLTLSVGLSVMAWKLGFRFRAIRPSRIRPLAAQYRHYPLFSLPSDLVMTIATWLPIHILMAFSGAAGVGAFSMSTRLLGIPSTLVGNSVGEVFRQQAAADRLATGECRLVFRHTVQHVSAFAVPTFLIVAVGGPSLFAFFLGEQWREAGRAAQVLAPLFCIRLVVAPVTAMYYLRERLKEDLMLHILLLVFIAGGMAFSNYAIGSDPLTILIGYSAAYSTIYLVYLVRSYQLSGPVTSAGDSYRGPV